MLRWVERSIIPVFFFIIWIIMNEGFSWYNAICGVIVVELSLRLSSYLLGFNYVEVFYLPVFKFIKYLVFLIGKIYISGISATYMIVTGKTNPGFINYNIDKRIKNVLLHNLIASSITLTPGTITVENKGGELTVLALHSENEHSVEVFEPLLIAIEDSMNNDE